jgi:pyrimidine-nucleoside phosphorylase
MIEYQGGNKEIVNDYSIFGFAKYQRDIVSDSDGFVDSIKTDSVGIASMILGAGRATKESKIDHTAGIILKIKRGMKVKKGDLLARLFTNNEKLLDDSEKLLKNSIGFAELPVPSKPLILGLVKTDGIERYR